MSIRKILLSLGVKFAAKRSAYMESFVKFLCHYVHVMFVKFQIFVIFFFFFSKYPSRVTEVSLTGGEETVLESVKFDFVVSQTFVCKNNSKYSYTSMLIQSNFGKV